MSSPRSLATWSEMRAHVRAAMACGVMLVCGVSASAGITVLAQGNSDATGDPSRGKALYDGKGACATCHRVNGLGSRLGPDISDVAQIRRAVDLQ